MVKGTTCFQRGWLLLIDLVGDSCHFLHFRTFFLQSVITDWADLAHGNLATPMILWPLLALKMGISRMRLPSVEKAPWRCWRPWCDTGSPVFRCTDRNIHKGEGADSGCDGKHVFENLSHGTPGPCGPKSGHGPAGSLALQTPLYQFSWIYMLYSWSCLLRVVKTQKAILYTDNTRLIYKALLRL